VYLGFAPTITVTISFGRVNILLAQEVLPQTVMPLMVLYFSIAWKYQIYWTLFLWLGHVHYFVTSRLQLTLNFIFFLFFYYILSMLHYSNTTCYCNLTFLLLVFIYICSLGWFIFTKCIECMYLMNCFRFLLVSSLLLAGQLPSLRTMFLKISLSFFSLLHWNIRWSTVCMLCLHGHSGLPIIFNRCK